MGFGGRLGPWSLRQRLHKLCDLGVSAGLSEPDALEWGDLAWGR